MRLVRFLRLDGGGPGLRFLHDADVVEVPGSDGAFSVEDPLASGRDLAAVCRGVGRSVPHALARVRLLPPVSRPGKAICVGHTPDDGPDAGRLRVTCTVPPRWLSAGDVVESTVAGIGTLRNEVVHPGTPR